MNLPSCITLTNEKPGCPILNIKHRLVTGRVALLGGHVMEWTPVGKKPVLYMSEAAVFEEGKPIRGGIPICWPWFGPREGLPSHGCVRTRLWTLAEAKEGTDDVHLKLTFESDEQTMKQWPHAFKLVLDVKLGLSLRVDLSMVHLGTEPVEITGALHTYLTVGAIEKTTVLGLDGKDYHDTLDNGKLKDQTGDVAFTSEVDRVYRSRGDVTVQDDEWKRAITVSKRGSGATVVWNPWIEKSKRLDDLPDEAYHRFLCIEAANAGDDRIRLKPNGSHVLTTIIDVV